MSLSVLLSSERRMPVIMALVFLPWIAAVLFTAGGWAALNFFGYAIDGFCGRLLCRQCGVACLMPEPKQSFSLPQLGILVISALTAFWVRLGLPLIWVVCSLAWTDGRRSDVPLEGSRPVGERNRRIWRSAGCAFSPDLRGVLPSRSTERRRHAARRELQLDLRGHAILPLGRCEHQKQRRPSESTRHID